MVSFGLIGHPSSESEFPPLTPGREIQPRFLAGSAIPVSGALLLTWDEE